MSPVYKRCAHQRRLRAEYVGIDLFERFTTQIVVAVAGRPGKTRFGDAVRPKGVQHLFRIFLRRLLKAAENGL